MVWLADEMIGSAIRLDNGHSIGYNDCSEAEEMTERGTYFIIATSRRFHCHCLANSTLGIVGFLHIGARW
jgi:hypothetical protein